MPINDYVPLTQAIAAFGTPDGQINHHQLELAYPDAARSFLSYTKIDPKTGELLVKMPAAVKQQVAEQDVEAAKISSVYRVQTQMDAETMARMAKEQATEKRFSLEDMQKALEQQQMSLNPPKKGKTA